MHHKLGFNKFGQSLSDNEKNEKFIQILRKASIRYVREGTPILEFISTEISSSRDAVQNFISLWRFVNRSLVVVSLKELFTGETLTKGATGLG
jgi:hypothetical protein